MPSRRNSKADRERRREDADHRAANRARRTPREQFDLLDRAPGRAAKEMRKLRAPDNARSKWIHGKPNHFYNDALGDPATCTEDHNHPTPEPMHLPDPPHVSG